MQRVELAQTGFVTPRAGEEWEGSGERSWGHVGWDLLQVDVRHNKLSPPGTRCHGTAANADLFWFRHGRAAGCLSN